jgi:hypothetical protein
LPSRELFLKDTGRKLAHIEKQLRTGPSISEELSCRLSEWRLSRCWDRDEYEQSRPEVPQSRMRLSQGRGGAAGSDKASDGRRRQENSDAADSPRAKSRAELVGIIHEADRPTMSELIVRLENRGLQANPQHSI